MQKTMLTQMILFWAWGTTCLWLIVLAVITGASQHLTRVKGGIGTKIFTKPMPRFSREAGIAVVLGIMTVACGDRVPVEDLSPSIVTATIDASEQANAEDSAILIPADRQLVLWAPPFFQPSFEPITNDPMNTLYEQFERDHPGVHVDVQIRAESGEAGMLSYLRSAQRVAPTILPDVILMDTQQLWQVAELGLLMPLEQTPLFSEIEFFPQLLSATTYNDQAIGVPYMADLTHLLYYADQLSSVPSSWEELIAAEQPYIFAAGKSESINEFVYLQYLGVGGDFTDEDLLTEDRLEALYASFIQARTKGIISETVLEIASFDRAWDVFAATNLGMAETSTHILLEHWDAVSNGTIQSAQIPTLNGENLTLARVWAFAIVTDEPEQRELSLALLNAFLDPTIQSEWSNIAMYVPTQPNAFAAWQKPSPYFDFLRTHIDHAVALPNGRRFHELNRRLQYALELVLRNEMTAEEAVLYVETAP